MTEDELNQRLLDRQVQALSAMSPDDWHRVADAHNWNESLEPLHWIVSRANCDKATARLVFWKGEPTCYDFEECDEKKGGDPYAVEPMLAYIVRRFAAGGYTRDELEFNMFQVKTGCYDYDDPSYVASVRSMIANDIDELTDRVPAALLVAHAPGRRVSKLDGNVRAFETYPSGVDYDTGELVYL